MRRHRSSVLTVLGVAVLGIAAIAAAYVAWRLFDRDPETSAADVASSPALITRGEYLARAADCAACHNAPGGRPFAGGLPFKLPFGTIYSTNITADKDTGIGSWSDDDFVRALHRGVAKDGSHLYPAFPYTSYTKLSRDDAVAIKAYLFSLPPVQAPARPNDLIFPFNQRWAMAFWNLVFLDAHRFRPDANLNDTENRGAYLATALGHCGECHTPRNIGFALDQGKEFAGEMLQGWHAYNITSDQTFGIGAWSDQQIGSYLSTGHADGHGSASGPMGEAVSNSLQYLTAEDIAALVSYLRRVKPLPGATGTEVSLTTPAMADSTAWAPGSKDVQSDTGRRIFESACASCHQWNGQGQQTAYAALAGSQGVNDPAGTNVMQVLLQGASLKTSHETVFMPSFAAAYTDAELAAVANYVIGHFGGKTGSVTAEKIQDARGQK
jgi:mono/diheme cytochrome c family protein